MVVVFDEGEARVAQQALHPAEPLQQRLAVGDHEADPSTQALRPGHRRQMELAAPDIDPHIVDAGHHVGIAREAQATHVEDRRQPLVGNPEIDVL